MTLKDQDFLQSFKKLDITQSQAEKIISQLEQDVEVLTKNGFIDYSLFMIIVLRPFKIVEHFVPSTLGVSAFDEVRNNTEEKAGSFTRTLSLSQQISKRLFIGEVEAKSLLKSDATQQLMLVKEQTKNRTKIYHICDAYDIASIRAQKYSDGGLSFSPQVLSPSASKNDLLEDQEEIKQEQNPLLSSKPKQRMHHHHVPASP